MGTTNNGHKWRFFRAGGLVQARLDSGAIDLGKSAQTGKPPERKPKFDVGVVAALGVAVGGITAALGMVMESFFGLGIWMPLGIVAPLLLISGSTYRMLS